VLKQVAAHGDSEGRKNEAAGRPCAVRGTGDGQAHPGLKALKLTSMFDGVHLRTLSPVVAKGRTRAGQGFVS